MNRQIFFLLSCVMLGCAICAQDAPKVPGSSENMTLTQMAHDKSGSSEKPQEAATQSGQPNSTISQFGSAVQASVTQSPVAQTVLANGSSATPQTDQGQPQNTSTAPGVSSSVSQPSASGDSKPGDKQLDVVKIQLPAAAGTDKKAAKKSTDDGDSKDEVAELAKKAMARRTDKFAELSQQSLGSIVREIGDVKAQELKEQHKELLFKNAVEKKFIGQLEEGEDVISKTFLEPWQYGNADKTIDIAFENMELSKFISYMEEQLDLKFITDDAIQPLAKGEGVMGSKITFTSNKSLPKKQAWDLFVTFLDIAGLAIVPTAVERTYRITTTNLQSPKTATRNPLPTFFNTDVSLLPDNDTLVRYVYFVENADLNTILKTVESLKSPIAGPTITVNDIRALIITDKARSIAHLLTIIRELDKGSMPEALWIVKLYHADAGTVAKLYQDIAQSQNPQNLADRLLGPRKLSTVSYFSDAARVIAEPRTNSLILLGPSQALKRIEDFIRQVVDKKITLPFTPVNVYTLKYTDANAVAKILMEVVRFQENSDAAKVGGVRNGEQFFRRPSIVPEPAGNRLVITSSYEDYLKLKETIDQIDIEQPQIALKVFILNVDVDEAKKLGVQLRNKKAASSILGKFINYQTSGLNGSPIVEYPYPQTDTGTNTGGANRLLGSLINIASTISSPGSTLMTLGCDAFGVWGLLQALQTYTHATTIANPFLVVTQRYPASIVVGETRRVIVGRINSGQANAQDTFDDLSANIKVNITPQISYEGFVTLDIRVEFSNFTSSVADSGNRIERVVQSSVIVKNNDTLALGGLMRENITDSQSEVPVLGKIPVLGWLFKNKNKEKTQRSLLILVTPEIIPVHDPSYANNFSDRKIEDIKELVKEYQEPYLLRDPINRWFFGEDKDKFDQMDIFKQERGHYLTNGTRAVPDVSQEDIERALTLKDIVRRSGEVEKNEAN